MTQTVPDISPLMPMHQDPLLVSCCPASEHTHCGFEVFLGLIDIFDTKPMLLYCQNLNFSYCFFSGNMKVSAFPTISQHWVGAGYQNHWLELVQVIRIIWFGWQGPVYRIMLLIIWCCKDPGYQNTRISSLSTSRINWNVLLGNASDLFDASGAEGGTFQNR